MIDLLLLLILVIFAIAAVSMKDLLNTTIILGAYSMIMAIVWTRLNAVDVAFTEASVGAGITTMLMLAALSRTRRKEDEQEPGVEGKRPERFNIRNLLLYIVVVVTFGMLIYGTIDMPDFGDPNAPVHTHVADRYIKKSYKETGELNFVSAILANYRGYDTLGETTVIFTAGVSVVLLLKKKKR